MCASSNSLAATSLRNRLKTIFKKAYELSILCQVEVCVIYYGPNGELKTWPKEREIVRDRALRYNAAAKRKNSLNLNEFLDSKKKKSKTKRESENVKYPYWYQVFDHYSPNQLYQLILSLEGTLSTLQEKLCFVEAQKQRNINLVHQSVTPSSMNQHHHQNQTVQPLNPSQLSLYLYNRDDATLSQLPLSASHSNQLINYQNQSTMQQQQRLYDFDHKITNRNFQQPCVSNTQDHTALLSAQESGVKNHLMQQQELYGSRQNMCMMNTITNSNVLRHPCPTNTVPEEFSFGLQKNPDGDMVGRTSGSQDFPNMCSAYDASRLLQTSSLPSLHQPIPNSYLLPDNPTCL